MDEDSAQDGHPTQQRGEPPRIEDMTRAEGRRWLAIITARIVLTAGGLLLLYWLIPVEWFDENWAGFALLVVGLLGYLVFVLSRMRHLRQSPRPMIELGESMVAIVIALVTLFAFTYVVLSRNIDDAFNVALDKHSALYFSMTVTTTTGFGDVVAQATSVRDVVTFQMFVTLLVLAVAIRGVTAAAQVGHRRVRTRDLSSQ